MKKRQKLIGMDKMKILEKITYKIILIVIVVLNICIGSNIKDPIWIIQIIVQLERL